MLTELVRAETADGLTLDGAFYESEQADSPWGVIILHGVGGNFYGSRLLHALTVGLLPQAHVLRVNTRGHDGFFQSVNRDGPCRLGAAYEIVDHCRLDALAWLHWLGDRGLKRLAVIGHSLGAIKALYSQAHQSVSALSAVVALSAPRLSAQAFLENERSGAYLETLNRAKELDAAGRGDTLIESKFPFPMPITAACYLDKYGGERYNLLNYAERIACPSLFVYGQLELDQPATFAGLPELIEALPGQEHRVLIQPEADHFYRGCEDSVGRAVADWLRRL